MAAWRGSLAERLRVISSPLQLQKARRVMIRRVCVLCRSPWRSLLVWSEFGEWFRSGVFPLESTVFVRLKAFTSAEECADDVGGRGAAGEAILSELRSMNAGLRSGQKW